MSRCGRRLSKTRTGYDEPNTFGLTACVAAYRTGDAWLQAVRTYIYENYLYLKNCLFGATCRCASANCRAHIWHGLIFVRPALRPKSLPVKLCRKPVCGWMPARCSAGREPVFNASIWPVRGGSWSRLSNGFVRSLAVDHIREENCIQML